MKYYADGSSVIGVKSAYCVVDETGKVVDYAESNSPNDRTNNEEEYNGVISALKLCSAGDIVCSDSLLVVNQVRGLYKVKKSHLRPLCNQVIDLMEQKGVSLMWIPREENLAGKIFE